MNTLESSGAGSCTLSGRVSFSTEAVPLEVRALRNWSCGPQASSGSQTDKCKDMNLP